jgi:hypothetical protein
MFSALFYFLLFGDSAVDVDFGSTANEYSMPSNVPM